MSMELVELRLSPKIKLAGMFAVLSYFVDYLVNQELRHPNTRFQISLDNYTMYQSGSAEDVYDYYFKRQQLAAKPNRVIHLPVAQKLLIARAGYMTKLGRANARELLPPRDGDRQKLSAIIHEYLSPNERLQALIDAFIQQHFGKSKICGVHLRGSGRKDGGTSLFYRSCKLEDGVPYEKYFELIRNYLSQNKDAKIFICSDSKKVIKRVSEEFGERVVSYDSELTEQGEPHIAALEGNTDLNKHKLGEDVIVEAYLLSKCDHFIHGNSSISNFVVCMNPELNHEDVYEPFYSYNLKGWQRLKAKLRSLRLWSHSWVLRVLGKLNSRWSCPDS